MITEEIISNICISRGLKKLGISKFPTWIDKNHQEGIEFVGGILRSFWVKDGMRIMDEPASDFITKTISEIQNIQPEKKEEKAKQEPENNIVKPETDNAELPEVITPAILSKWAKMNTMDRVLLFQKTPKNKIKQVVVGKNANGKDVFAPYVEGNYMFREANAAFLFDWYLSEIIVTVIPTGVSVIGILHCWFSEYQKYLTRPATGYQEINKRTDTEIAKKGATTDAIKKGLSLFGFNQDVYGGDRE